MQFALDETLEELMALWNKPSSFGTQRPTHSRILSTNEINSTTEELYKLGMKSRVCSTNATSHTTLLTQFSQCKRDREV